MKMSLGGEPRTVALEIPGKALLFGEYGVLRGGSAVAVTLPEHKMVCRFEIEEGIYETPVSVSSAFFESGVITLSLETLEFLHSKYSLTDVFSSGDPSELKKIDEHCGLSRDERFFASLFLPFLNILKTHRVSFKVTECFSPSLGFGSSSALIAGVHAAFKQLGISQSEDEFWLKCFVSLQLAQGAGSGYDFAVQILALNSRSVKFWHYKKPDFVKNISSPLVQEIYIPSDESLQFGCFLETGCYSDTQSALKNFGQLAIQDLESYSYAHSLLCSDFLNNSSYNSLSSYMYRSRLIAFDQGILPRPQDTSPLSRLVKLLQENEFSFKSMGAGRGDCLWILSSRAKIEELLSGCFFGEDAILKNLSVVFSFENQVEI